MQLHVSAEKSSLCVIEELQVSLSATSQELQSYREATDVKLRDLRAQSDARVADMQSKLDASQASQRMLEKVSCLFDCYFLHMLV